jgi:hypothetical protein
LIDRLKGRWQPFALLAVFILPTAAAMIMVFSDWRPESFTNNGDLVQPAEQINPGQWQGVVEAAPILAGDWLIVTPQRKSCGEACRERVDRLNRAQIALDRDIERVRLVVLQPESLEAPVFEPVPGILNLSAADAVVDRLAVHNGEPMAAHIVDYRGYHVMRYPRPLDASGLLDDLENLLSLAKEEAERRALEEAVNE